MPQIWTYEALFDVLNFVMEFLQQKVKISYILWRKTVNQQKLNNHKYFDPLQENSITELRLSIHY